MSERISDSVPANLDGVRPIETQEARARRLFDEMARNIGREAVNHLKTMYPHMLAPQAATSKSWELSLTNHIRNDINWRMRPLLLALIAVHQEWAEETDHVELPKSVLRKWIATVRPLPSTGEPEGAGETVAWRWRAVGTNTWFVSQDEAAASNSMRGRPYEIQPLYLRATPPVPAHVGVGEAAKEERDA